MPKCFYWLRSAAFSTTPLREVREDEIMVTYEFILSELFVEEGKIMFKLAAGEKKNTQALILHNGTLNCLPTVLILFVHLVR